jgi:hypothetical protein
LKKYLKDRTKRYTSTRPLDPLFITGNCQVLDRYYFLSKVKHVLQLIGYDPNRYNGPSFRSGAATSASKVRMEDHFISKVKVIFKTYIKVEFLVIVFKLICIL